MSTNGRLSWREKIAYGLGDVAGSIVWSSAAAYLTYYYTNVASISAAVAGSILLISRILDCCSDVIMGSIVDKTRSRFGKARPWILWACGPFALSAFLLFSVPMDWSNTGKVIYAFLTYNFMSTVCYTAITLPYSALSARMTNNQKDRTALSILRMVGAVVMGAIVQLCVLPLATLFGDGNVTSPRGWALTYAMLGAISACIFLLTFFGVKECVAETAKAREVLPVRTVVHSLFQNKFWVILLCTSMMGQMLLGTMGVHPYYAQYWLGDVNMAGVLSMAMLLPMLLSIILSSVLFAKMGIRNGILCGLGFYVAGAILQLLNPQNFTQIIIGAAIRGFGIGPASAGLFVLLGEVSDYQEWRTGIRSEGMVFAASSFGGKVGSGLGASLLGWALALGGYDAAAAVQTASAMNAILAIYIYVPIAMSPIMIILYLFYGLDKIYPKIMQELAERKEAEMTAES